MTKAELFISLSHTDKKHPNWTEAFQLYKAEFPSSDLKVGCRSCRDTVLNWLKRG